MSTAPATSFRQLTARELADVTAPWAHIWTDQSFGIANAAIAKFCEVNNVKTANSAQEHAVVRDCPTCRHRFHDGRAGCARENCYGRIDWQPIEALTASGGAA